MLALLIIIGGIATGLTPAAHADFGAAITRQCDLELSGNTHPAQAKAVHHVALTSIRQARHVINIARRTLGIEYAREFEAMDSAWALADKSVDTVDSKAFIELRRLFEQLENQFHLAYQRRIPELRSGLQRRIDVAQSSGQSTAAAAFNVIAADLDECSATLVIDRCLGAWQRVINVVAPVVGKPSSPELNKTSVESPIGRPEGTQSNVSTPAPAPALAPAPADTPQLPKHLRSAQGMVNSHRASLERYLTSTQLARVDAALTRAIETRADRESPDLHFIDYTITYVHQLFFTDFTANIDRTFEGVLELRDHARARGVVHESQFLTDLMDRLTACRSEFDSAKCFAAWDRAQRHLLLPRAPLNDTPKVPASVPVARPVPVYGPEPLRPYDGVELLDALGSDDQKGRFRSLLIKKSLVPSSIDREIKRSRLTQRRRGEVSNLNNALKIFIQHPRIRAEHSKVVVRGKVMLKGEIVEVEFTFDPRLRYFTVLVPDRPFPHELYYLLDVHPDGSLEFIDRPPVPMGKSAALLEKSHFAY